MRRIIGGVAGAALVAAVLVVAPRGAGGPPPTRSSTTVVNDRPVAVAFPVDYVGVRWTSAGASGGAVRFRHAGSWGPWQPLIEDGADVEHAAFVSGLVWAADADAYQVRVPAGARRARAMAIDTTSADAPRGHAASAETAVLSRAAWGADESLRRGTPTYYAAQKLTVHHTATRNDDTDPAATVRAIYEWHVNGNGWDDIGYQYLIDEAGRVYEGRWSGTDGDPAHDTAGRVVTGAHVGGMNSGNVGIALLGTLSDRQPTPAARGALEQLLRELTARHAISPTGSSTYVNPVSGATRTLPNIPGHRDWEATECPGAALYALLPSVRASVATSPTTTTTTTSTTSSTTTTTKAKRRR